MNGTIPLDTSLTAVAQRYWESFLYGPARTRYWWLHERRRAWRADKSDLRSSLRFLSDDSLSIPVTMRLALIERFFAISRSIKAPHAQYEMLEIATAILRLPRGGPGVIVEAGTFKGASAAKLSLCAHLAGRRLVIFDSFQGIPRNNEVQAIGSLQGVVFHEGQFAGSLEEVQANIAAWGSPTQCSYVKGWFNETMPHFNETVSVAYLDVDLVSSTRDCLINLYPRLEPGGIIFSQDAHLSKVVELLDDDHFWQVEVGCRKPAIRGLRRRKMVAILKPMR